MRKYVILQVFGKYEFLCCFDDMESVFKYIKIFCNDTDIFYIQTNYIPDDLIEEFKIPYIKS